MKLTPERREELRELCEKATPEPWHLWQWYTDEDARFISAARSAMPECLTALDDAEKRIAELEAERDALAEQLRVLTRGLLRVITDRKPDEQFFDPQYSLGIRHSHEHAAAIAREFLASADPRHTFSPTQFGGDTCRHCGRDVRAHAATERKETCHP